jgi:hypothetical protein
LSDFPFVFIDDILGVVLVIFFIKNPWAGSILSELRQRICKGKGIVLDVTKSPSLKINEYRGIKFVWLCLISTEDFCAFVWVISF